MSSRVSTREAVSAAEVALGISPITETPEHWTEVLNVASELFNGQVSRLDGSDPGDDWSDEDEETYLGAADSLMHFVEDYRETCLGLGARDEGPGAVVAALWKPVSDVALAALVTRLGRVAWAFDAASDAADLMSGDGVVLIIALIDRNDGRVFAEVAPLPPVSYQEAGQLFCTETRPEAT